MSAAARRTEAPPFDVRATTLFALSRFPRALRAYLRPAHERYGLYEGRDLVVMEIARLGPDATAKELCASLGLTPGSLSTVLRRSVESGYVAPRRNPKDGRSRRLDLTMTGAACAALMGAAWDDGEAVLAKRLGPAALAELHRMTTAATAALDAVRLQERALYFDIP